MKTIKYLLILVLFSSSLVAQAQLKREAPKNNVESNHDYMASPYQLFPTQNMYTFLKLDTRNGKIWQVQWSTESSSRFEVLLSDIALANKEEEKNGRFLLYPTTNLYNFILLDKQDGRIWQVQWGKEEYRAVFRIN
ncbi:hypothetical protein [uncultured Flavobacterium sp.]|uniref:hypothetical protein n=1 Tax=uncultured Flavobacterium sp. TaxID=165435 RepID=UPI0025991CE8|nr:hypothetical protein [uncultured Flavobacterium sp.]